MAWRIDEQVVRGEIDNRTRGRVTGRIWFHGRAEPVALDLAGNPWRDLAGHRLVFTNPDPKPGDLARLRDPQHGVTGDITASRKVKVPDCSMEDLMEFVAARQPFPWHWGNSLYLEWFSETNGRVVIESAHFQLALDGEAAWTMSEADEEAQRHANAEAMAGFMTKLGIVMEASRSAHDANDDEPTTRAEAEADEEDARMQLLLDRVQARIEREGRDEIDFDEIYQEERARLMRERGEVEPELTPEQEAEREQWIEEMNAVFEEAMAEVEAEAWKEDLEEDREHPLVEQCRDLAVELHKDVDTAGWIPPDAQREHPVIEIVSCVMSASAKLAGALGMSVRADEWPPEPLIAGNVIVRLKKARGYLDDALRGIETAEEESLATPQWRQQVKSRIIDIHAETTRFIREARQVLEDGEGDAP